MLPRSLSLTSIVDHAANVIVRHKTSHALSDRHSFLSHTFRQLTLCLRRKKWMLDNNQDIELIRIEGHLADYLYDSFVNKIGEREATTVGEANVQTA